MWLPFEITALCQPRGPLSRLFFSFGTSLPSRSLIPRADICVRKHTKICMTKLLQLKRERLTSTLLWSAQRGRKKQNSWKEPEKCFLESHFHIDQPVGNLVSENALLYSHLIALASEIPLETFSPWKDIQAQKPLTITSDPTTISGPWQEAWLTRTSWMA